MIDVRSNAAGSPVAVVLASRTARRSFRTGKLARYNVTSNDQRGESE
jgi:hypothetical protein